jgi:hypothetical protein
MQVEITKVTEALLIDRYLITLPDDTDVDGLSNEELDRMTENAVRYSEDVTVSLSPSTFEVAAL